MDLELLDQFVHGVGALLQVGQLLACCRLSVRVCEYQVDLGLELIHRHWHLGGGEYLLDLVRCSCPSCSAFHV